MVILECWSSGGRWMSGENRDREGSWCAVVESTVYTPYWLAFEMLNIDEVVAGKEKVYIYLDHRIEVGGTLLNPRA